MTFPPSATVVGDLSFLLAVAFSPSLAFSSCPSSHLSCWSWAAFPLLLPYLRHVLLSPHRLSLLLSFSLLLPYLRHVLLSLRRLSLLLSFSLLLPYLRHVLLSPHRLSLLLSFSLLLPYLRYVLLSPRRLSLLLSFSLLLPYLRHVLLSPHRLPLLLSFLSSSPLTCATYPSLFSGRRVLPSGSAAVYPSSLSLWIRPYPSPLSCRLPPHTVFPFLPGRGHPPSLVASRSYSTTPTHSPVRHIAPDHPHCGTRQTTSLTSRHASLHPL